MNTREPAWLQGLTSSPCSALAWQSYDQRQFCVLPFYPDGDRDRPGLFAMWGRALSDGSFYPIPPSMYRLDLFRCNPDPDGTQWYQWNAQVHGKLPYSIPVEMQRVRAVEVGRDQHGDPFMALEDPTIVTPEFVEEQWGCGESAITPTVFYPDASLWSNELLKDTMGDDWFPEMPSAMCGPWVERPVAPVETYFCPCFKQITLRSASSRLWNRNGRASA